MAKEIERDIDDIVYDFYKISDKVADIYDSVEELLDEMKEIGMEDSSDYKKISEFYDKLRDVLS